MTKYEYVTQVDQYVEAIEYLTQFNELAADTETYVLPKYKEMGITAALDPHSSRISIFILKGRKGKTILLDIILLSRAGADFSLLKTLLETREYSLWHNAKFDIKMIKSTFGWVLENTRCTMTMAKIIGNATGSKIGRMTGYSYADICRDLFNVHISGKKTDRESTWHAGIESRKLSNPWWKNKLDYASNDVKYLFAIQNVLLPTICNPRPRSALNPEGVTTNWGLGLQKVWEVENEYVVAAAEIEYVGIGVSYETIKVYQEAVKEMKDRVAIELSKELGLDDPMPDLLGRVAPTNKAIATLNSPSKILELIKVLSKLENLDNTQTKVLKRMIDLIEKIYAHKSSNVEDADEEQATGLTDLFVNSTEDEVYAELLILEESELLKVSPLIKKVIDYKMALKQEGMDLKRFISPVTGRIHHTLVTIGAATGRSSSCNPNLQQCSNKLSIPVKIKLKDLWHSDSKEIIPWEVSNE